MTYKVSILITCYNKQFSIAQTIESAINQTGYNGEYEILVIDDCSTDNSVEEIKKFKEVTLYQNEHNQGVLKSTFIATKKAVGDIIILLDGDDVMACNTVEIIFDFLTSHPDCALYTRCIRIDDQNTNAHKKPIKDYKVIRRFRNAINIIRRNKTGTPALGFYKKDLLEHEDNIPPILIQDHVISCLLAQSVKEIYFIDALTHYIINWGKDSHITSNHPQLEHDRLELFWQFIECERKVGNYFFYQFYKFNLIKKIRKRNTYFNLEIQHGLLLQAKAFFNIEELEKLKLEAMKSFRRKYPIKFYQ